MNSFHDYLLVGYRCSTFLCMCHEFMVRFFVPLFVVCRFIFAIRALFDSPWIMHGLF